MEYLTPLWQHQIEGLTKARPLSNYGFFFEMGTGKTCTTINALREKYEKAGKLLRTLIFCPPIVVPNWKKEFGMHSKIPAKDITCLQGSGKKRLEKFMGEAWFKVGGFGVKSEPIMQSSHIFILNYQSLFMEELYAAIKTWDPEVIVFDESHRLKDYKSKTSKLAEALVNHKMTKNKTFGNYTGSRPYVFLLSGSPILNSPLDIFQQFKILDAGTTFGTNFFSFRATYFRDKNAGMPSQRHFPDWSPVPGALEKISERMKKHSMRVLKKDCLDLPPLVRQTIEVEMSPEQTKLYKAMLKDYVAYFSKEGKEHVASATLAITKGLRLMQISSGFLKTVDDREVDFTEKFNPKQDALFELLGDLTEGHKVIVWACWKKNYEQIKAVCEKLKIKYVEIHGDIQDKQKHLNVENFNTDKDIRVLIGHPGSGGIGINLVSASYSIFYSRSFSLEHDLQAEARNYRGGSEIHEKVTRIDLVSKDSIEEEIVKRLADKQEVGDKILREITYKLVGEL